MQESVFLASHVNEGRIKARHDFSDGAEVDVADGMAVGWGLTMNFDEFLVFEQGDLDFVRMRSDD